MNKTLRANICILLATIIWGSAFVAQRAGMDSIGPLYFNVGRNVVGVAVLVVFAIFADKVGWSKNFAPVYEKKPGEGFWTQERKLLLKGGMVSGVVYCAASAFQQIGLVTVDAGKSGFLTAMYIVIVPMLGIFSHKRATSNQWVGAILGAIGLYFLSIKGDFSIATGDLISLIGALFWALHILVIDRFAPHLNPIKLSAVQFTVSGILTYILALNFEDFSWSMVSGAGGAILYAGIMSTAVAFTLQVFGQKNANPTTASVLMSMEALFAVICGFLFLGEILTSRELLGCFIMLIAVLAAQVSPKDILKLRKSKEK